jgi:dihydroorotate dehydrogenase (NAD+) catalytic subunit
MANLKVNFCGVEFPNPLVLASGVMGVTAAGLLKTARAGAGGVTTKSIWLQEHIGHKNPTMIGTEHYFINAVGVPDAGIEKAQEEMAKYLAEHPVPLIANVMAKAVEDFEGVVKEVTKLNPDLIEINLSCPNVEDEFGKPLACSVIKVAEVVKLVKSCTYKPVIVKMSPNVEDHVGIALAAEKAGADALCCFNTFGPGLVMDIETRMPILANKVGGVSGPGIKPLVLKMVNDIYKAVNIPIIGTGGVINATDAIEMMMCGASLVGVGTMVYYNDIKGFEDMTNQMNSWLDEHGITNIEDIIGTLQR